MEQVTISSHLRPPRITFIVKNSSQFKRAVSYSTISWGGMFFTIVDIKATYFDNLLDQYKPDFIVPLVSSEEVPDLSAKYKERLLDEEELIVKGFKSTEYKFLDTFPIFRAMYQNTFKDSFIELANTSKLKLIDCYTFGNYHNDFCKKYYDYYKQVITDESEKKTSLNRMSYQVDGPVTPIISTQYLGKLRQLRRGFYNEIFLFLGSESNRKDVEALWNLRALGVDVLFLDIKNYKEELKKLKKHKYITRIIKSKDQFKRMVVLTFTKSKKFEDYINDCSKILSQQLMYNTATNILENPNLSNSISIELSSTYKSGMFDGRHVRFDFQRPKYFHDKNIRQDLGICFEVPRSYSTPNQLINSVPKLNDVDKCLFMSGPRSHHPYRFDDNKITHFDSTFSQTESCWLNSPFEFWERFFRDKKLIFELSAPGKNLETIVSKTLQSNVHMSGRFLKFKSTRELLFGLNNNKSITHSKARGVVSKNWPKSKVEFGLHHYTQKNLIEKLVSKKVLRQGYELKCENCHNETFYSIKDIGHDWECRFCYERQVTPCLSNQKLSYKSDGIFQLRDQGGGLITSLLTLWFFHELDSMRDLNYLPSFVLSREVTKGKKKVKENYAECDTLLMIGDKVVLVESKTKNDLEESDFQKIKIIRDMLDCEVYYCYSNLKSGFSNDEKDLIMKYHKDEIYNVILLTEKELDKYSTYDLTRDHHGHGLESIASYSREEYLSERMKKL